MQTVSIQTVTDKTNALEQRKKERRELGAKIDKVLERSKREMESEATGCGSSGVCPWLARMVGVKARPRTSVSSSTVELARSEESGVSANASRAENGKQALHGARMFGSKQTPEAKLEAASQALQRRVDILDKRAQQHRENAAIGMRAGKKAEAIRELKKAKACERQVATAHGAIDTMEQQTDLIAQTALQREIAAALGATAKTMKKDKKLLSNAEDAVDTASEMRDLGEDLASVMSSLGEGAHADHDEDDLLEELEAMIANPATPPDPSNKEAATEATVVEQQSGLKADMQSLEERHRQLDEASEMKKALPSVPAATASNSKKKIEKRALLSSMDA